MEEESEEDDDEEMFPSIGPYQCEICQNITDTKQVTNDFIFGVLHSLSRLAAYYRGFYKRLELNTYNSTQIDSLESQKTIFHANDGLIVTTQDSMHKHDVFSRRHAISK